MENKMTELLPCPFCGGKAEIMHNWQLTQSNVFVKCGYCGCQTVGFFPVFDRSILDDVIAIWNRRTCSSSEVKKW